MISSLRGTVLAVSGTQAVIDVGGVGYSVAVTPQHALQLRTGAEAVVHTTLIVREDDMSLYAFEDLDAQQVFDLLRGVTGVGPKSAMAVLATMSPDLIADAVATENDSAFRKVSGIGPKTAKLIIVSLTGKVFARTTPSAVAPAQRAGGADVVVALVGLGWPERVAQATVEEVIAETGGGSTQVLLRAALSRLGPRQLSGSSS
ncbi:Holliday junction branch migration protein RuvA [Naasia lichenicola]|uniref:Holliday junction branch migration complex subunit RuvA n=1 Tax=Naasia lichenicola TaxID=2565933 RepID=A0A4S4FRW1_9MICO|nr:Holliday junction branch migration protein RuvA [Naasia lichenicola]THG33028.1 Holliday junction branch migration protein RuvA [Naasia lichenicola]